MATVAIESAARKRRMRFMAAILVSQSHSLTVSQRGRAATKCHPERESRDLGGWGTRNEPGAPPIQVPRLTLGMTKERGFALSQDLRAARRNARLDVQKGAADLSDCETVRL